MFAILGLRSLYFALADMIHRFRFLTVSLAVVLAVVGVKMLLAGPLKAALGPSFNLYLLVVVLGVLAAGVIASWWAGPAAAPANAGQQPHADVKEPPAA
ncbi:Inner membrane protein alx [compost metagenome]